MASIISLPHRPERSQVDNGRSFPRRQPFIFALIAMAIAGLVVLGLYVSAYFALRNINPLGGFGRFVQGGNEASTAAGFAASEGLTYGQLTQTELQARFPSTSWLSPSTVSTYTNGHGTNVSFLATGDHIVTAVAESGGICAWGLAVQSTSDPIITSDKLSGSGVYYTFTSAATAQYSGGNPPCEAGSAPTSGWSPMVGTAK
jgi:hypothetical protein